MEENVALVPTQDSELTEKLARLQEQIRNAKSELLYRTDELERWRQKRNEMLKDGVRHMGEVVDEELIDPIELEFDAVDMDTHAGKKVDVKKLEESAVEILKGFITKQLAPVYKSGIDRIERLKVNDSLSFQEYFQVDVLAGKQVCSMQVKSNCSFKELLDIVVLYWKIEPRVAERLTLVGSDGAIYPNSMNVKDTLSLLPGAKNEIHLIQRPVVSSELLASLNPREVVRNMEKMRIRHERMKRAMRVTGNDVHVHVEGEDDEMTPIRTERSDSEESIHDSEAIDVHELNTNFAPSRDLEIHRVRDKTDSRSNREKKASEESLAREYYTYFLVLDCMVFAPAVMLLLFVLLFGFYSKFLTSNVKPVESDFQSFFFNIYPGPPISSAFNLTRPLNESVNDLRVFTYTAFELPFLMFKDCAKPNCLIKQYNVLLTGVRFRQLRVEPEASGFLYDGLKFPGYSTSLREEATMPGNYGRVLPFLEGNPGVFASGELPLDDANSSCSFSLMDDKSALSSFDASGFSFVIPMYLSREMSEIVMNEIKWESWFEASTRAIFVEFSTFNINTGVILAHQFAFQKNVEGSYSPLYLAQSLPQSTVASNVDNISSYVYAGIFGFLLLYITVARITLLFLFREKTRENYVSSPRNRKKRCFKQCGGCKPNQFFLDKWLVIDVLIVLFGLALYATVAAAQFSQNISLARSRFLIDIFFNYQELTIFSRVLDELSAAFTMLCFFRLLRVLLLFSLAENIVTAITTSFHTLTSLLLFVFVPLYFGLTTFMYVALAPYYSDFGSFQDVILYSVRLMIGFPPILEAGDTSRLLVITSLIYLFLISYFASMLFILVLSRSYATVLYHPPMTRISSIGKWYDTVKLLRGGPRIKE